jgi:hypothetical protein
MTVCEMVPPATRQELVPGIAPLVRPWEIEPYAVLSWWDMEQFSAAAFHYIGATLVRLAEPLGAFSGEDRLEAGVLSKAFVPLLENTSKLCGQIGLRTPVRCIQDFVSDSAHGMTASEVQRRLQELENTISWEMRDCYFFHMPSSQADFYDQKEFFGPVVNAKFPSIQYDMVEAGNCYAMGRGTACVFHLMRVMEFGVQCFGTRLGVGLTGGKNWQNILDQINREIKSLPPKDPTTVAMSLAAANLYAVKLAWRNEVMHPNDKYTLEEAKDVIYAVRLFMGQLAAII